MKFDSFNKVIVETLNKDEAKAFVKFLYSECQRHERDIEEALQLAQQVRDKFKFKTDCTYTVGEKWYSNLR